MRRALLPVSILAAVVAFAALLSASDTIFSLTGWAEIPSTSGSRDRCPANSRPAPTA